MLLKNSLFKISPHLILPHILIYTKKARFFLLPWCRLSYSNIVQVVFKGKILWPTHIVQAIIFYIRVIIASKYMLLCRIRAPVSNPPQSGLCVASAWGCLFFAGTGSHTCCNRCSGWPVAVWAPNGRSLRGKRVVLRGNWHPAM